MGRSITASQSQLTKLKSLEQSAQEKIDSLGAGVQSAADKQALNIELGRLSQIRGQISSVNAEIRSTEGTDTDKKDAKKQSEIKDDVKAEDSKHVSKTESSSKSGGSKGLSYLDPAPEAKDTKNIGAYGQSNTQSSPAADTKNADAAKSDSAKGKTDTSNKSKNK